MSTPKQNPKRWYMVMVFCLVFSFFVFAVGPMIGYRAEAAHAAAVFIGLWAPTLGVLGLRSELMQRKE